MAPHVLAIDEGGTGARAYVFDQSGRAVGSAYAEIDLICPHPGWVEHDPAVVWDRTVAVARAALADSGVMAREIAGLGIANQRASAVVWDSETGTPLYHVIGWQDVRTVARCTELGARGFLLASLHAAPKYAWVVEHVPAAQECLRAGRLRCGTLDTWLGWQLSGGRCYVTDASNASCTGVYDFVSRQWDETLLEALGLPPTSLPTIVPTSFVAGRTTADLLGGEVALAARAGDQQAAMFGQLCTEPGMSKITYGTAAMMDLNVGSTLRLSPHGAFPLVLWQLGDAVTFCLEGTAVTAGAAIQWLRDGLGIIDNPGDSEALAASVPDSGGVWCVPAFQGLGTPYLDVNARALIGGLSRGSGRAHVVRAVLEGIAFRCREVLEVLGADQPTPLAALRVDGGAARNGFLMQCQADVSGLPIERPVIVEAASLGAGYLAGLATGVWKDTAELANTWRLDRVFEPRTTADERETRFAEWKRLVALSRTPG